MFATELDEEYDFIVVGSGAGGGPVAAGQARIRWLDADDTCGFNSFAAGLRVAAAGPGGGADLL